MIQKICVYCGSSSGAHPEYIQAANRLGQEFAARSITLVYGGGKVGLMGEIARAVMNSGGKVIGVIPRHLVEREVSFNDISEQYVVDTMHERKAMMADLADAFVAMPGGLGTLDEMAEILTWSQLGLHHKPCGFLNICGYFSPLVAFIDLMVAEQFVDPHFRGNILVESDPAVLLDHFNVYSPVHTDKAAFALKNSVQK